MTFSYRVRLVIVAAITGVFRVPVCVAQLTILLSLAAVIEGKIVDLQCRWRPGTGTMTVFTFQTEEPRMDLRFGVALYADSGCSFENLVRMAGLAFDLAVLSIQWKEVCMVEILHPVRAIVALHTIGAIICQMFLHESRPVISLGVAGDAVL